MKVGAQCTIGACMHELMHAWEARNSLYIVKPWIQLHIYIKNVIPPGIEPGTLSVLDSRDNHYTMESLMLASDIYT